jgi:hypothetical protein
VSASDSAVPPIRLLLELDRNDDPQLYDDLMRFRKGAKRVSRLRLLAHDGLLPLRLDGARSEPLPRVEDQTPRPTALAAARLTSQAFDAPNEDT